MTFGLHTRSTRDVHLLLHTTEAADYLAGGDGVAGVEAGPGPVTVRRRSRFGGDRFEP